MNFRLLIAGEIDKDHEAQDILELHELIKDLRRDELITVLSLQIDGEEVDVDE